MKNTVYIPSSINSPEFEILLSKCQIILDKKEELDIIVCGGSKNYACSNNIFSQTSICKICKKNTKKGLKKLKGKFNLIYTPSIKSKKHLMSKMVIKNVNTLKRKKINNYDIGLSVYSSYINTSRDHELEGFLANYSIKKLFSTSLMLNEFFQKYVSEFRPKKIILYNGRHNQNRVLLRCGLFNKIDTEVMEFSGDGESNKGVRCFENHLPTDLDYLYKIIQKNWRSSSKKNKCDYYFKYKAAGKIINDKASYILKQKSNIIPSFWKKDMRNIVYFTSSQDEYAALGGKYDETIYKDQTESIQKIIREIKKNNRNSSNKKIYFWIRCHPNLENVFWNYNRSINKFHDPQNCIFVIPPNSEVSSYKIMRICEKVLTYNSLTGIEAVYWNKPSIVLGRRVYEKLNCIYSPKNHEENMRLIFDENLKKKGRYGAFKFASFWVEGGFKLKYLTGSMLNGYKFKNQVLRLNGFQKWTYYYEKIKQLFVYNYIISFKLSKILKKIIN